MQLEGKVVIITGGGKGIGKAIALAFAREGAELVLAARTSSDLKEVSSEIESMGGKSLPIVTDLANPEQVRRMVGISLEKFAKVDVLVNNSGIAGPIATVVDMDLDGWNRTLAVNLTGAMLSAKYVLKNSMIPRRSGSIINISSTSGRRGLATRSPYSSSKWALIGLTQSLASEAGRYGIRVNCIAPGRIEGDRIERIDREMNKSTGITNQQVAAAMNLRTALGRMVKPEEVAALAVFLASDQSSGIAGQTINCCAGFEMD